MARFKAVTDEPPRGVLFPAWTLSLPGTERVRLYASGAIPPTPAARLYGQRIGHVSPGTVITTMPASAHLLMLPAMDISPVALGASFFAATTAVASGYEVAPTTASLHYFRSGWPRPGNFLARARVLNSSSLFVSTDAEVEDPEGRQLGHCVSQWAIRAVEPPPPAVPDGFEPSEEPAYPTSDPPSRPAPPLSITPELMSRVDGQQAAEMLVSGQLDPLPYQSLLGTRWLAFSDGEMSLAMPASPWFCVGSHDVWHGALAGLISQVSTVRMLAELGRSQSGAALEINFRFLAGVPADGRELRARAWLHGTSGGIRFIDTEVTDADGRLVAMSQGSAWAIIDRPDRRRVEPQRALATLVFTDIVGSTDHLQALGDDSWRTLLGEHNALVRRQLTAHRGREIKTTGDGFLAQFDSPAAAVRFARAVRDGVLQMNLEIRASVHTGEVEIQGLELSGITVHTASRIMDSASPGEILVSQVVKDLAAGSSLRFDSRGPHTLKGVEGDWTLYAVTDDA